MNKPHKNAEFIKAWAKGHEVEYLMPVCQVWKLATASPHFDCVCRHRVYDSVQLVDDVWALTAGNVTYGKEPPEHDGLIVIGRPRATPHKYFNEISAWADGARIEIYNGLSDLWACCELPLWVPLHEYRVQPEKTEPVKVQLEKAIEKASEEADDCEQFKKDWLARYYPIRAENVPVEDALDHSIKKWTGLQAVNLDKYNPPILVFAKTCALCVHYYNKETPANPCYACPIVRMRGYACDRDEYGDIGKNEWSVYKGGNPAPMLRLLLQTEEFVNSEASKAKAAKEKE